MRPSCPGTGNAAARTGMGAVMGSKKPERPFAVRGRGRVSVAKPRAYINQCRELLGAVRQARLYDELHQYGLTRIHDREMRGAYRLLGTEWKDGEKISEEAFIKQTPAPQGGMPVLPGGLPSMDTRFRTRERETAKCSPYGDLSWDLRNSDLMVFWQVYVDWPAVRS